jgi:hypothetical protein
VIVAGGGENLVAAAQHVLPHDLRRHVRISGLGEVAVGGTANESALTLWIEPTGRFTIRNYRREWRALPAALLLLITARAVRLSAAATLSASALVAPATSVVPMIALALLSAPTLVLLTTATAAAIVLLIERLLL